MTPKKPWTQNGFYNNANNFQFAIVSDRTGGHREGVFGKAIEKLNLLNPEFVMSVGDLIEGYTLEVDEIQAQWAEFDSILNPLEMRFFALPGNHDISNDVMRQEWMKRYDHAWYHFKYRDVLFIAMDTNDGDGVNFSTKQIDYVLKAINDNKDASWTMIFMHHPVWNYSEINGFGKIEAALKDRPYTVLAGHNHRYYKTVRENRNYYILATTGGGSRLRGPRFGQFDHVTWVTMTEEGPEFAHLELNGIIKEDVLGDHNIDLTRALLDASQMKSTLLKINDTQAKLIVRIDNPADQTLQFNGRFYHSHLSSPSPNKFTIAIEPKSFYEAEIVIDAVDKIQTDTLELDWTLSFGNEFMEPPYQLTGIQDIPLQFVARELNFSAMDIFLDNIEVKLTQPFDQLNLRYTLDGSIPDENSPIYQEPITLSETTNIKAAFFDKDNQASSEVIEKAYKKVSPIDPIKINEKKLVNELSYKYYEGDFKMLPDFKSIRPKKTGTTNNFDVRALADRKDHYAFLFEGYIEW
ncbi:MAG: chitobiase/beta-hexosaminidase C-terminal domain-containing protein [Bacteroidota bacterium]